MAYYPDLIQVFKSIPIFLDLKDFQLARLAEISEIVEVQSDSIIMNEGDKPDCVFIVLEGEIQVEVFVPVCGNTETSRLGPLDILGWTALTPVVRQRTGTAIAVTTCTLLKLDGDRLIDLCEKDHDIGLMVYKRISNVAARSFLTTRLQLMNLLVNAYQSHKVS